MLTILNKIPIKEITKENRYEHNKNVQEIYYKIFEFIDNKALFRIDNITAESKNDKSRVFYGKVDDLMDIISEFEPNIGTEIYVSDIDQIHVYFYSIKEHNSLEIQRVIFVIYDEKDNKLPLMKIMKKRFIKKKSFLSTFTRKM